MAITFRGVNNAAGQNNGSTSTSTVSISTTLPASTAAGDRVFIIQCGSNTSGTAPTDWNLLGTKDTVIGSGTVAAAGGLRYMTVYYRDYNGSWTMPALTLTSATNNSHWVGAVSVTPTSGSVFHPPTISTVGGSFNTATTSYTDTSAASFTTTSGGFLIAATCLNDNVTASAGAITQSGATLGTVTERCDGGTATGNDVAGKIFTCSVTTGASATITHTETISAASQGETLFIEQTEFVAAKMATLVSNFDAGVSSPWGTSGAAVTTESGAVRISHSASASDYQYINTIATGTFYDLRDSSAYIEVRDFGNQALPSHHMQFLLSSEDSLDTLYFFVQTGNLFAFYKVAGGSVTALSGSPIALNTTDHRWLRIREASGTTYFDTSPNGSTWTNQFNVASPTLFVSMYPQILCGEDNADGASSVLIDNFNTPPSGTNYTPTITPEAVGITDSMTKDVGETTTDAVGITDSVAKDAGRTLTDTVGVSDSLTKAAARSDTDAVGITDSVTKEAGKTSTDNVGVTDSYVQTQDWARSVTDLVGVTDSASFSLTYFASTTDPVGLTDAVSAALGFDRSVTDLVGVTDAVSAQQDWVRSPTDPVGAQDSLSSSVGKVYTDPVGITDSSIALDQGRLATDPLSIADAVSKDIGKTATDPVGVTDSAVWTRSLAFADLVGLTDSFAKVSAYVQSQIDPVGVVDSATFVGTSAGNVDAVDLVGITDSLSAQQSRIVSFTDSVGVTDSFSKDAGRAATDPVGVADSLSTTSGYVRPAADAVAINDALVWASSQEASNAVGLSDAATFELSYIRALTDPVGVTDNLSVSLVSVFSDTDAVGIADFATFTLGDNVLNATDPVGIMDSGRFFIFLPPSPDNSWVPRGESVQHIPKTEAVRYAVKIESTHSEVAG